MKSKMIIGLLLVLVISAAYGSNANAQGWCRYHGHGYYRPFRPVAVYVQPSYSYGYYNGYYNCPPPPPPPVYYRPRPHFYGCRPGYCRPRHYWR